MISPNGFASADVARKAEADAKDADARRVAMINLHIAGHRLHGRNWNLLRGTYVLAASNGRTASSREATSSELRYATGLVKMALDVRPGLALKAGRYAADKVRPLINELGHLDWIGEYELRIEAEKLAQLWAEFWAQLAADAAGEARRTSPVYERAPSDVWDFENNCPIMSRR